MKTIMCSEPIYYQYVKSISPKVNGSTEKSIYALKQASIWLSRIDSNHTTIDIDELSSQLDVDRDTLWRHTTKVY